MFIIKIIIATCIKYLFLQYLQKFKFESAIKDCLEMGTQISQCL